MTTAPGSHSLEAAKRMKNSCLSYRERGLFVLFGGKEPTSQCRRYKRCGFNPWVRKIPWRREWQPVPVFLPGEFIGQRRMAGYGPWGSNELDRTE